LPVVAVGVTVVGGGIINLVQQSLLTSGHVRETLWNTTLQETVGSGKLPVRRLPGDRPGWVRLVALAEKKRVLKHTLEVGSCQGKVKVSTERTCGF
jgi:hypothetical protein